RISSSAPPSPTSPLSLHDALPISTSATQQAPAATAAAATRGSGPVAATPATRRLARELGVDIHTVRGTGHGGRVSDDDVRAAAGDRKSTRLNSSHQIISYAVFCLK